MPDSPKNSLTRGDLRASKGAFIFIPEGTKQYLRVEIPNPPPTDFLTAPVELSLEQSVKSFIENGRFGETVTPEHGIPEQIGGVLKKEDSDRWTLSNSIISIEVQLPSDPTNNEGKVFCEMSGPLKATQVVYLDQKT